MRIFLFLFVCTFHAALSQDVKLVCGKDTIRCNNGGKRHFEPIINCPYVEYQDTTKVPSFICDINRKYLIERMGVEFFYSKVKFRGCDIIENEKYSELKSIRGFTDKECCNGKIKYAFEYYFVIRDDLKFYFTTIYDEKGNLISKNQTPDFRQNNSYSKTIDACEAKVISDADSKFKGETISLTLEYSNKNNCFVWIAEKTREQQGNKITTPFVIINAQTKEIIAHKTTKGTIVCALPSF